MNTIDDLIKYYSERESECREEINTSAAFPDEGLAKRAVALWTSERQKARDAVSYLKQLKRLRSQGQADVTRLTSERDKERKHVANLMKRINELEVSNKRWQANSRDTFEAMVAMRNAINEYIPMPSLESDLLQGPESGVFCSTVAEAVAKAVKELLRR